MGGPSPADNQHTRADALSALELFLDDCGWMQEHLWIIPKEGTKRRLEFNEAQIKIIAACVKQLSAGKPVRLIVLKARQLGISTFFMALSFCRTYRRSGVRAMMIAHQAPTTKEIWQMTSAFFDNAPTVWPARRRFARTNGPLVWKHASRINIHTAGGHGVGHGGTLGVLHLSEGARYGQGTTPEQQARVLETVSGIRASLADTPDSIEVVESTANGVGGWFHTEWMRAAAGKSDYEPVFIAWFEDPGYTAALGTCWLAGEADLSEYERSLRERFGLSLEQLCWRRWKLENAFAGDLSKFKEQYPSTPEEAFIVSGASVFEPERIAIYSHHARPPVWRGDVAYEPPAGWLFDDSGDLSREGPVQIWEFPKKGEVYVLGADVAECLDTRSDRDALVVRNARTLSIAALAAGWWELGDWARKVAALGWYYNQALVAVERNAMGPAVIGALRGRLGGPVMYRRLYRFKRVDQATGRTEIVYGFPTTANTKHAAVEAEKLLLRQGLERNPSADILAEAATFVNLPRGKMGASAGCRDDLVTAWCISAMTAPEAAAYYVAEEKSRQRRTEELLDSEDDANPWVSEIQL
jgi:hypothetical protein